MLGAVVPAFFPPFRKKRQREGKACALREFPRDFRRVDTQFYDKEVRKEATESNARKTAVVAFFWHSSCCFSHEMPELAHHSADPALGISRSGREDGNTQNRPPRILSNRRSERTRNGIPNQPLVFTHTGP